MDKDGDKIIRTIIHLRWLDKELDDIEYRTTVDELTRFFERELKEEFEKTLSDEELELYEKEDLDNFVKQKVIELLKL